MKLFDPQDLLPSSGWGISYRDFVFVVYIIYNTKEHVQLSIENEMERKRAGRVRPNPTSFRREAHKLGAPGQHDYPNCNLHARYLSLLLLFCLYCSISRLTPSRAISGLTQERFVLDSYYFLRCFIYSFTGLTRT